LPQWNCSCPNCQAARQGRISARTQSCVALGDDHGRWFLVNASPDLPFQIQRFPDLQPRTEPPRNTPIAGVLLTNCDLDHVLGLFSLREGGQLNIFASRAVRTTAESCLGLETVLNTFCGSIWHEPPTGDFEPLSITLPADSGRPQIKLKGPPRLAREMSDVPFEGSWSQCIRESERGLSTEPENRSSLLYRAIVLPGTPPPFAKDAASTGAHSLAFQFLDQRTGGRLIVAPDVAAVNPGLLEALTTSDAILFDGTFWSADELGVVKPKAQKAADMGHVTIQDCSLELLANLAAPKKIYIHINNTNPILAPGSREQAAVQAAGIIVGSDGLEFEL